MKVTRYTASRIFHLLEAAALGSLDEKNLEAAVANFSAFRKVVEELELLKAELFKRLYGGINNNDDASRERLSRFFDIIKKIKSADAEDRIKLDEEAKSNYPELYELRQKELATIILLLNKEIEIKVEKVDGGELIKCILAGRKGMSIGEIYSLLSPMFEEAERAEVKSDEIDELLK